MSGSKDMLFQSKKCRILAEIDKGVAKSESQSAKKSLIFRHFELKLKLIDFIF